MDKLSLQNPVFATYVIAATLLILKAVSMSWLTVARMIKANGGFKNPEDLKKTPFNPKPNPNQLDKNEGVERVRRVHQNDLENIPFFLVAGFLYLFTDPSLLWARIFFFGYVVLRLVHSGAYLGAATHDTRAKLWTLGSLVLVALTVRTLLAALAIV